MNKRKKKLIAAYRKLLKEPSLENHVEVAKYLSVALLQNDSDSVMSKKPLSEKQKFIKTVLKKF